MLLLVTAALAVPSVGITVVWQESVDDELDARLCGEADKLRRFARTAREPDTGKQFTEGAALLTAFMTVHLPSREQTFFSIVDGRADRRSPHRAPARLDRDPAVVARLSEGTRTRTGWLDSPAGKVRYGVVPVRVEGDPHRVRLVILEFRDRQIRAQRRVADLFLYAGSGGLVLAGLASWVVAGRVLAPIRLVRQAAAQIGESDLTRRLEVTGADDVAALARTFNHMLDRLERGFTAQRRFLDEVAHELRTPITVVRGHLELMDERPEERAATRALVVDELDRMSRIVDDLLLLAKAERPDFLTPGPVSLTDLVVDVVAKSRALGDRDWRVAHVAEETVLVDGQRLTQALMQLAANAVRHTRDGDLIETGSLVRDGRVRLWVRDTGPGVPTAERERVFGRFAQLGGAVPADPARTGIGLGLAIVMEIAQAHGGAASVVEPESGGACFVIELPAHFPWHTGSWQRGHHESHTHSGGRAKDRGLRRERAAKPWLRHRRRR
ncbi:sensor histidine kinase [Streptomyces sp. NPDC048172]|uniref:sensor histidine kinase n=1 Tax=Streptomyces sp. NPDC048172 TaxID=3365505 RepID=UPI0037167F7E